MNKRIILVGPAASGKDFLRNNFVLRGFTPDVSYTTRPIREGEINDQDYHYISEKIFDQNIALDMFYEWVQHGDYKYGTGEWEWDNRDIFIMETEGIKHIKPEDRKSCFIIYLDIPEDERIRRMRDVRKWEYLEIQKRILVDKEKFEGFKDYDLRITNPNF